MPKKVSKIVLYLKLSIVAMCFGGTFIAAKVLSQTLPPFTASFLRFSGASVFLGLFLLIKSTRLPNFKLKIVLQIFLLSFFGIVSYNYFFFSGMKYIDASRASVIASLSPASISILSFIFFRERISSIKLIGIIISFIGATIVIIKGQTNILSFKAIGIGEVYIFGCVICWSIFTIISKITIKNIEPLATITLSCLAGAWLLFIPAWQEGHLCNFLQFDFEIWISVFVLSILGTALAYIWYYEGLEKIGASSTGVFINFIPVWTTALSVLVLSEQITISFIIGFLVVLSGVIIVNKN